MSIISNLKGFSERGAIGYCNTVLYTYMCRNYSKSPSINPLDLEEKIMEVEYDLILTEYCRVFIKMSEQTVSKQPELPTDNRSFEQII